MEIPSKDMKTVSPEYAAQHFLELMRIVSSGEEILVSDKRGPIARISPFPGETNRTESPDEADAPEDEVERAFYGD